MSKLNIKFNDTDYQIDESALTSAKTELKAHLSSVMNGSGSVIKFSDASYNIDSSKLITATNDFVSHLGTISGSGEKVVVNGTEYGIGSTKVNDAVAVIASTLDVLSSGGNEGDEEEVLPYLTFTSPETFTLNVVDKKKYWDGTLEYSTDLNTWNEWDGTTTLSADNGKLYMRGTGNTHITSPSDKDTSPQWKLTGSDISCSGNIENLLDYAIVANGEHPAMANYCYRYMFSGCTSLITAPELPATTLADWCYGDMFSGCTSLTTAPELPATTLADYCYGSMFQDCTSLTIAPELPATTLADGCYTGMFRDCTSLTIAPELPATTLAVSCYERMFRGCISLTTAPELPATTLVDDCYRYMFYGCTSLITLPKLSATTLAEGCYEYMFCCCTNIKLSTTQTDEYQNAYTIPSSGNGIDATDVLSDMFFGTGGTFTGTPTTNTTYYLHNSNTVV